MTQFYIDSGGMVVPNPGHEAAWSCYENLVLNKYHSLRNFFNTWLKQITNNNDCKIFIVLFQYANWEDRWWVVENHPVAIRAVLFLCGERYGLENMFEPEMLTYLRMVA